MKEFIYDLSSGAGVAIMSVLGLASSIFVTVWVASKLFVATLRYLQGWAIFIEYAFNRKLYLKWRDEYNSKNNAKSPGQA